MSNAEAWYAAPLESSGADRGPIAAAEYYGSLMFVLVQTAEVSSYTERNGTDITAV